MRSITGTVYDGSRLRLVVQGETAEGAIVVPRQVAEEVSRLLIPGGKVSEVVKGIVCHTAPNPEQHKAEADELVRRFGSKDQIQRQTAGLLPDEEFRELVRRHIFGPAMIDVDGHPFPKFDGVEDAFTHRHGCAAIRVGRSDRVSFLRFESGPASDVPGDAWERLLRIDRLTASLSKLPPCHLWTVSARLHRATCKSCGETQTELGALVSIYIAGRKLSREYAL